MYGDNDYTQAILSLESFLHRLEASITKPHDLNTPNLYSLTLAAEAHGRCILNWQASQLAIELVRLMAIELKWISSYSPPRSP